MSLSREAFESASDASEELMRRLIKLLGYNHDAITDHYEMTFLYNQRIFVGTPDEEILEIRERFLRWQEKLLAVFAEYGATMDAEQIKPLFSKNGMQGEIYFLNISVDIDGDIDRYRPAILSFLEKKGQN